MLPLLHPASRGVKRSAEEILERRQPDLAGVHSHTRSLASTDNHRLGRNIGTEGDSDPPFVVDVDVFEPQSLSILPGHSGQDDPKVAVKPGSGASFSDKFTWEACPPYVITTSSSDKIFAAASMIGDDTAKWTETRIKSYKCDDCSQCFYRKGDLERHQRVHTISMGRLSPNHLPPLSDSSTPQRWSIQQHMRAVRMQDHGEMDGSTELLLPDTGSRPQQQHRVILSAKQKALQTAQQLRANRPPSLEPSSSKPQRDFQRDFRLVYESLEEREEANTAVPSANGAAATKTMSIVSGMSQNQERRARQKHYRISQRQAARTVQMSEQNNGESKLICFKTLAEDRSVNERQTLLCAIASKDAFGRQKAPSLALLHHDVEQTHRKFGKRHHNFGVFELAEDKNDKKGGKKNGSMDNDEVINVDTLFNFEGIESSEAEVTDLGTILDGVKSPDNELTEFIDYIYDEELSNIKAVDGKNRGRKQNVGEKYGEKTPQSSRSKNQRRDLSFRIPETSPNTRAAQIYPNAAGLPTITSKRALNTAGLKSLLADRFPNSSAAGSIRTVYGPLQSQTTSLAQALPTPHFPNDFAAPSLVPEDPRLNISKLHSSVSQAF